MLAGPESPDPTVRLVAENAGAESLVSKTGPLAKPACKPCFVDPVSGHREDGFLCLVDVRWIGIPNHIVEIEEHHETCPTGSLVPIRQG